MKMYKLFIVILLTLIVSCSTPKKNNCDQLIEQSDFTIINGIAFHDTFNENEYTTDEYGEKYIDPEKMEFIDWFAYKAMFKISKEDIINAGSISWDKINKELIVRNVNKIDKKIIKNTERRLKYKIENYTTYLSEDGVKWSPIEVVVNGYHVPTKENYKKKEIMIVGLYSDLFRCKYEIYATHESKIKYRTWEYLYGIVVIDGKEKFIKAPDGNTVMTMSSEYINKQNGDIIQAKHVNIIFNDLWEKNGTVTISDGYKNKKGYNDEVPNSEKKFKYVIKEDKGYLITWDEKDCDVLKVKILEKNQDKPMIKFSLECKWFKGEYEIRGANY